MAASDARTLPGPGADLRAGLAIAGLQIPAAIAYAGIANLPPQAGVVALLIGMACYGLLGRSRFAIVSSTSSSAAVLAAGTLALASVGGGASRTAIATTVVALTGVLFLLSAFLRLGGLSQLVARPVLRGFAFGLAGIIAIGQLPHLAGLAQVRGDSAPILLWRIAQETGAFRSAALACGLVALALLWLAENLPRVPGYLLVIVLGIATSPWLAAHGVALTGPFDLSMHWALPAWPSDEQWLPGIELGAALVLVLYAESYGSIRTFALRHGDEVEPNRDLFALGIANLLSGLLQGMPVGAGYSATSLNEAAGARSRAAGWIATVAVLAMVLLLLRWIERIPEPVLAAIVIHSVSHSWRMSAFRPYLQWRRDRLLALAAVLAVLGLGVLHGLLAAIALSLVLLLRRLATPRLSVLGRLQDGHDFVPVTRAGTAEPAGVLVLRPEEPLFFANAEAVFELARMRTAERENLHDVVLSLEESPDLDSTALETLGEFAAWLETRGLRLRVARLKDDAREALTRAAFPQLPVAALDDFSVDDAVRRAGTPP